MTGWIKLHRSLKDWEWYDDHNATRLLIHILISVNYEDKNWRGIEIKAGSMVLSWKNLSLKSSLSVSQCRTAMDKLVSSNEITRKVTNKYQVISLTKWDKLQQNDCDNSKQNEDKSQANYQSNRKQIASNLATTKEVKNIKEVKENKKLLMSEIKISDLEDFDSKSKNHFQIAEAFRQLFIKNLKEKDSPTTNQDRAKYKAYVNPIRLMMEQDGVTKEQLQVVFKFLSSEDGEFWKPNILSTSKLREKFSVLIMKANEKKGVQTNKNWDFDAQKVYNGETAKTIKFT